MLHEGHRVVKRAARAPGETDDQRRGPFLLFAFKRAQYLGGRFHEHRTQDQVFGRVADNRQFGKDDDVGTLLCRGVTRAANEVGVSRKVTDLRIELRERDSEGQGVNVT